MIIVTGTKRSGTSMWMQILAAAGFKVVGEAFPARWKALAAANPDGFYESKLRQGIYHATNPHPDTGAYLFPQEVEDWAVKVFIPGLTRTDMAFIGKVVATMRPWREYESSLRRFNRIEAERREKKGLPESKLASLPPYLEWWDENYSLIRDIDTRQYPVHVQSYDGLLEDPEAVISATIKWLGGGNIEAAIAAVKPKNRTQHSPESDSAGHHAEVFDELYDVVHRGRGLGRAFLQKLEDTNDVLEPRIAVSRQLVKESMNTLAQKAARSRPAD